MFSNVMFTHVTFTRIIWQHLATANPLHSLPAGELTHVKKLNANSKILHMHTSRE